MGDQDQVGSGQRNHAEAARNAASEAAARQRFFAKVRAAAKRANLSPEAAADLAEEAVSTVRTTADA